MSGKKWTITFVGIVILLLISMTVINHVVDPFGYFRAAKGDCYDLDEEDYVRYLKAEHIAHFSDKYDGYILGGSKAGALLPSSFEKIEGKKYYSVWNVAGCFNDYYLYTKYIVENTNAKKIVLHLSNLEINSFDSSTRGDMFTAPAILTGGNQLAEKVSYSLKNLKCSWEALTDSSEKYPLHPDGSRNLDKYIAIFKQDPEAYVKEHVTANLSGHLQGIQW